MTDLPEVVESVAKALELQNVVWCAWWTDDHCNLHKNGSNLTDPYWFKRCFEWLHEQGAVYLERKGWNTPDGPHDFASEDIEISVLCPLAEAPARLVHELMRREP